MNYTFKTIMYLILRCKTFVINSNRNYGASLDKTPYDQGFTSLLVKYEFSLRHKVNLMAQSLSNIADFPITL